MFRLLPTTKRKRQQIAILIISFFAYVAGIRNEDNNMLLQQQHQQHQPYHTTIENSNYKSPLDPLADMQQQQTHSNFRPSPIIDFTTADATLPQHFEPLYMNAKYPNTNTATTLNTNTLPEKLDKPNDNRRYGTYENLADKQFSFTSNEQQQQPPQQQQHLTDRPIYIYRDPYTNENYHYKPTEAIITQEDTALSATTYNHNNYNGNGYKQPEHNHQHNNQEYLVQSSMVVGTQQNQQQLQQHHPYMSLSDDKDVYLKRPGKVYDEKTNYEHPNLVSISKKSGDEQTVKANKISYDSHDYPPPSYAQQQTSNFLPTPVPEIATPKPTPPRLRPTPPPRQQEYRPPLTATSSLPQLFGQQQQYLQSSQSTLPNYANNIDNYLSNKQQQQQFDYYRTETPPYNYLQQQQQQPHPQQEQYETLPSYGSQNQQQYESRPPPSYTQQYESEPPFYQQQQQQQQQPLYVTKPPISLQQYQQQQQQYESRPPSSHNQNIPQQQSYYPPQQASSQHQPPGRPSYNNYYDYQIGEVPPQKQPSPQNFNNPYDRPPNAQYPQQGPYRPPPGPPPQQQQSGFATLAQYAPQFTSLLLGGGGGSSSSNTNSPLGSLIGALTGATTSQQPSYTSSSPSSSYNRRPVNSQLIKALENIARNDDLQCVPKVVCQMIAAQTQRGQLPTFITSPAITNFLAGFPAASPALIYGRGALLGLSGGEKSCHQAYVKCPKNELEIIYYLNNHRGGFFKFFSEPEEQQQNGNLDSTQQGASSLFSILAALTGGAPETTTTPRPKPKPQAPSTDITGGIGNFFTQLLSDYMGGATVEYQRRRKRRTRRSLDNIIFRDEDEEEENHKDLVKFNVDANKDNEDNKDKIIFEEEEEDNNKDLVKFNEDPNKDKDNEDAEEDFDDEEDTEDTQQGVDFKDDDETAEDNDLELETQGRILHKPQVRGKHIKFFPETKDNPSNENDNDQDLKHSIKIYNDFNKGRKFKFPQPTEDETNKGLRQGKALLDDASNENDNDEDFKNIIKKYNDFLKGSKFKFPETNEEDTREGLRQGKELIDDTPYQEQNYGYQYTNYVEESYDPLQHRDFKKVKFQDDSEEQEQKLSENYPNPTKDVKTNVRFPERLGKILNYPDYAASYTYNNQQNDQFILPNNQRPSRYTAAPQTSSANVYNTHINSINTQNSFSSSSSINNNNFYTNSNKQHFLPTPPPTDTTDDSNFLYSESNDFNNNEHNYDSQYQSIYNKPQRYPSSNGLSSSNNQYQPQRYQDSSSSTNRYPSNYYTNNNRYHSSLYTTRRPYTTTTKKADDKNIYITNSRGETEYYVTPDGRKIYL